MRTATRLLVVVLALAFLPAAPAAAAACLPAGGATIPAAKPAQGDFMISGRGWGHGVGMSQYGARGAGNLGCTAAQILTTYYPGTAIGSGSLGRNLRVSLATDARSVPVEALDGTVSWVLCSPGCAPLVNQGQGTTWTVAIQSNGSYRLLEGSRVVWQGGSPSARLELRLNNRVTRVRVSTAYRYKWGTIEFRSRSDQLGRAYVTAVLPMDHYLYGLSEVPSSWPAATLQAQAIAGRSYALRRAQAYGGNRPGCICDVYATVVDQHFTGYEKAAEPTYGQRWTAAVAATAGQVLRYGSAIAETYYSSSHGGYSESSEFVWGGAVPYLRPVDDTRWELASSNPAGNLTWSQTYSAAQLGAAFGVGVAQSVTLPNPKGHGGRIGDPARGAGGVIIQGTGGRRHLSGEDFRRTLGLKSTLFTVTGGVPQLTWSRWAEHPGSGLSAPAVVSWGEGRSDLFAIDGDGRLVQRWFVSGSGWGPAGGWHGLGAPPGVRLVGQPAVASQEPWSLDVFARGSDDALWQRSYRPGKGWSAWLSRGGVLTSSPGAVSWGRGHVAVVVVGSDRAVWLKSWTATGSWTRWVSLGGTATSAPGVASWEPGRLDVFVRGVNESLYHRTVVDGRPVSAWLSQGGVLTGDGRPDAVSWGRGRFDVFVVGAGGSSVYRRAYHRGYGWLPTSGYERLGAPVGSLLSGTAVRSWRPGQLEFFVTDTSGRVWHRWTT